jgi:16S rRNA (cytidine1402-2'-O)-methyltransferase
MRCLAYPGADLPLMASEKWIAVEIFAGFSSILLALVLSGLCGQHFTFQGYLPKEVSPHLRAQKDRKTPLKEKSTDLLIEAQYRIGSVFRCSCLVATSEPCQKALYTSP